MIRRRGRTGVVLAAMAFAAGGMGSGCSDDDTAGSPSEAEGSGTTAAAKETEAHRLTGSYVGTVEGTDAYVAIVVADDGRAMAFVTDGGESVDWLDGFVAGDGARLANDGGARLTVASPGGAPSTAIVLSGTFARPDSPPQDYEAGPVEAPAGLYRASQTFDDGEYAASWVVLEDGSQKGAVRRYETPLPPGAVDPELDLSDPRALAVDVPGGVLHPLYVDPDRL